MSRVLLREAAAKAGITEEQAERFVRAIFHPTTQQVQQTHHHAQIPARAWGADRYPEPVAMAWRGLSWPEYQYTRNAHIWRLMVAGLTFDQPNLAWSSTLWDHPITDFHGQRIKAAFFPPGSPPSPAT